jgi:hypothetical protein
MHKENQKEFFYSVLRLDKFTKTNEQLKSHQDRWISLFVRASEMNEDEVNEIFGDESMFQEIFHILKLDSLISDEREEYNYSEDIRRASAEYLNYVARRIDILVRGEVQRNFGKKVSN